MTRPYTTDGVRSRKRWLWAVGLVVLACSGGVATIFWAVGRPLPTVKATALEILMGPCGDADLSTSETTSLEQDVERLRLIEAQVRRSPAVRLDLRDVALYDGVEYAFWFSAQASDRIRTEWNARARVSSGAGLTAAPAADWCYLVDVHHRLHYIGSVVAETDTAWFSGHPSSLDLVLSDHAVDDTSHVVGGLYLYTFYFWRHTASANMVDRWARYPGPTAEPDDNPDPWLDLGALSKRPRVVFPDFPLPRDDVALRQLMWAAGLLH